jgi:hypothetical protein
MKHKKVKNTSTTFSLDPAHRKSASLYNNTREKITKQRSQARSSNASRKAFQFFLEGYISAGPEMKKYKDVRQKYHDPHNKTVCVVHKAI